MEKGKTFLSCVCLFICPPDFNNAVEPYVIIEKCIYILSVYVSHLSLLVMSLYLYNRRRRLLLVSASEKKQSCCSNSYFLRPLRNDLTPCKEINDTNRE